MSLIYNSLLSCVFVCFCCYYLDYYAANIHIFLHILQKYALFLSKVVAYYRTETLDGLLFEVAVFCLFCAVVLTRINER